MEKKDNLVNELKAWITAVSKQETDDLLIVSAEERIAELYGILGETDFWFACKHVPTKHLYAFDKACNIPDSCRLIIEKEIFLR